MTPWNPMTHPYRVRWIFGSNASGCHGWEDRVQTFESEQAAIAAADDRAQRPSRWKQIQVDVVSGYDPDSPKKWRWSRLVTIKRGKPKA